MLTQKLHYTYTTSLFRIRNYICEKSVVSWKINISVLWKYFDKFTFNIIPLIFVSSFNMSTFNLNNYFFNPIKIVVNPTLPMDSSTYLKKWSYIANTFSPFDNIEVQYYKIFVLFCVILILSLLLVTITYFLSLHIVQDGEKLSQYECGFEPFDEATRHPFDVHFYVVGILFLIFDVEIALLFPWVLGLSSAPYMWSNFYSMVIFLTILTIGFVYEWHRGALVWPHKQEYKN